MNEKDTSIEKAHPDVGWTVETLRVSHEQRFSGIQSLLGNLREEIRERFKESDLRYQQRFDAQEKALEAALIAADKAVTAALTAAKQLVDVALAAADKAVNKAEVASEKRFENVNEFRQSLSDQTSTFIPRVEADVRFNALAERLARVETSESVQIGAGTQRNIGSQQNMQAVGILVAIVTAIAAVAVSLIKH